MLCFGLHGMNEIIDIHRHWTSFLRNMLTISVTIYIHNTTNCRDNVMDMQPFQVKLVLFNIRNFRILTENCSRCKKQGNLLQMLKFVANARINGFHEFRDFVILVSPYTSFF